MFDAFTREVRVFTQKTITGMHRIAVSTPGQFDQSRPVQIGSCAIFAGHQERLPPHSMAQDFIFRFIGSTQADALYAEPLRRSRNPHGDFAPAGNQ